MTTIPVVMCTDENGADFMQVAIRSLFVNHVEESIDLHIITDGLPQHIIIKLHELKSRYGPDHKLTIHQIESKKYDQIDGCGEGCYFPKAICFRFEIPALLNDCSKVIYLDTDVLIEKSLKRLWASELSQYAMAAVRDAGETGIEKKYIKDELKFYDGEYINSGVLLMNLDYFRKNDISSKLINYLYDPTKPHKFADQDALNVILRGKIKYLSPKFNIQGHHFLSDSEGNLSKDPEIIEAISNPVIIHFNEFKPWHNVGLPGLPYLRDRFEYYRLLPPVIKVKKRNYDKHVWKRRILYYLWKIGLTNRMPAMLKRHPGFDPIVKGQL